MLINFYFPGGFYGLLLIMIVFNLFLFFLLKDYNYLFYTLYILFYALADLCLEGLDYQLLWPEFSWWRNCAQYFFIGVSEVFIIIFCQKFLSTQKNLPKFDKLLSVLLVFDVVMGVIPFIYKVPIVIQSVAYLVLIGAICILIAEILSWKQGYLPARLFNIGLFLFIIGSILYPSSLLGILPVNLLTRQGMKFGMIFEVSFLSMALADRINILKKERENALPQFFCGSFEFDSDPYDGLKAWFRDIEAGYSIVRVFGHDGLDSLFTFWLYGEKTPDNAPVVYRAGEGEGSIIIADNFEEFLTILATNREYSPFDKTFSPPIEETADENLVFRNWLFQETGLKPAKDLHIVQQKALKNHPDFDKWLKSVFKD